MTTCPQCGSRFIGHHVDTGSLWCHGTKDKPCDWRGRMKMEVEPTSVKLAKSINREWLLAHGYAEHDMFGTIKELSDDVTICVGNFPFNEACVSIMVDGATILTTAASPDDIETLERLLGDGCVDIH